MPKLRYITADVFTPIAFTGNQLAVVFGADALPYDTLLNIAREFNYSETVFVYPPDNPAHTRRVRIFTPGAELQFAGHPTIGTAHVLVATGEVKADGDEPTVILEEGVGPVPVRVSLQNGIPVAAQLTAALVPEEREVATPVEMIAQVLSLSVDDFVGGAYAPVGVTVGLPFLLVAVKTVGAVRRAAVRMDAWATHCKGQWASEPMVFAIDRDTNDHELMPHVRGCDIRARVFVPGLSVPEDPATGSANACLAGYLAKRTPRDGVLRWDVAQGVEMGRPSRLSIEAQKMNGIIQAVRVGGATVVVSEGMLSVP